jgi:Flp pilus assembly protein TadG
MMRRKYFFLNPFGRSLRRGQTLVELALVLPILLMLLMMIVQYSIIMNAAASIKNLSREGARFAATQPDSDTDIKARMASVCPPTIKWSDVSGNVTITPAENATSRTTSGQLITVAISYNMSKKLFLPSKFFGIKIFSTNYSASTEMMIE